jgi:hypothetical protein
MTKSTHFIGRTDDGSRVWVIIDLGVDRVSFMGSSVAFKARSISSCGQNIDDVQSVTRCAAGWTSQDVASLVRVWDRWHLNDMRAECAHQRALGWKYRTHKGQKCPECGYEIGSAWLMEAMPEDVRAEIKRLQSLPAGTPEPTR